MAVAEAFLKGEVDGYYHQFVGDVVDKTIMEAARIRVANDATVALEARCARLERVVERLAINTGTTVPEIEKLLDLIDKEEG